jgi:hypothetical protein
MIAALHKFFSMLPKSVTSNMFTYIGIDHRSS